MTLATTTDLERALGALSSSDAQPRLHDGITGDQGPIGAAHEVAHALAYDFHGLDFERIEVDEYGCGEVVVEPRLVNSNTLCRVALAGQVVDLAVHQSRSGVEAGLKLMIDFWAECAASDDPHDAWDIDRSVLGSLTWAIAFVETNAALIGELADLLLAQGSDGAGMREITYETFHPLFSGRPVTPTIASLTAARKRCAPHEEGLDRIWVANGRRPGQLAAD